MIATFFTRRNTAYLLVAMAVALSTVSAETQHHIRARPVEDNLKEKLANKKPSKVSLICFLLFFSVAWISYSY